MRRLKHIIWLLMLLSIHSNLSAQKSAIANDHVVLLLDLNSRNAILDSLLKTAAIRNADINAIKSGSYQSLQQLGWRATLQPENRLRLERVVSDISPDQGFQFVTQAQVAKNPGYPAEVAYGVNNFARLTVHELPNGLTRFFVPGRLSQRRVMLSGNFNGWSTLKGTMLKTDTGWIKDIKLEPGVYEYKYIFDGNWDIDNTNNLRRGDGNGNTNSVYYRYNFSFKLRGYTDAHRVIVAGSFNKWNKGELIMNRGAGGWDLKLYVHEGTHLYHFLVDGKIVTDPENKVTEQDGTGNKNSVVSLGEVINFRLGGFENAKHVYLAGTFNEWKETQLEMYRQGGNWVLPYNLPPGNYQYKFIVDGNWYTDPTNPYTATYNGPVNSYFSVTPNHTFTLKGYGKAKSIRLTGTFNNWDHYGVTMEHRGDEWTVGMRLKPGKYLYKFIVNNDSWIKDPDNKLWEGNEPNNGNSILWVE